MTLSRGCMQDTFARTRTRPKVCATPPVTKLTVRHNGTTVNRNLKAVFTLIIL